MKEFIGIIAGILVIGILVFIAFYVDHLNEEITYKQYEELENECHFCPEIIPLVKKFVNDEKITVREYDIIINEIIRIRKADGRKNKIKNFLLRIESTTQPSPDTQPDK